MSEETPVEKTAALFAQVRDFAIRNNEAAADESARRKKAADYINSLSQADMKYLLESAAFAQLVNLYVREGQYTYDEFVILANALIEYQDVGGWIDNLIRKMAKGKTIDALAETLGGLIVDPAHKLLYVDKIPETERQVDTMRKRLTGMFASPAALQLIATALTEIPSLGQIDQVGGAFSNLSWSLGLGFLGWQVLSPLMTAVYLEPAERMYARKYRNRRFTDAQMAQLYITRRATPDQYLEHFRDRGWKDDDILSLNALAYRDLTLSQVSEALERTLITRENAIIRIQQLGYKPNDVPLVLQLIQDEKLDTTRNTSLATLKRAYREHLITTDYFINTMRDIGFSDQTIQLELSLLNFDMETEEREFTVTQIKSLFDTNLINQHEAIISLEKLDFAFEQSELLVLSWIEKQRPKIARLNQNSIKLAYAKGVLTREQAFNKLRAIPYSITDCEIILNSVGATGGTTPPRVTVAQLLQALKLLVITESEFRNRLTLMGASQDDINLWVRLAQKTVEKDLSSENYLEAYRWEAIDKSMLIEHLTALKYDTSEIEIMVETADRQKRATVRLITPAHILTFLEQGIITEENARLQLKQLGYDEYTANLFIQSQQMEYSRELSSYEIRRAFLTGVLSHSQAGEKLVKTGLSQSDAEIVLNTLEKELAFTQPQASVGALITAVREEILTPEEMYGRLQEYGFPAETCTLYVMLATYQPQPGTKDLSDTNILKAYETGIFDYFESMNRLMIKGYSPEDSDVLLAIHKRSITSTIIHRSFIGGLITLDIALTMLTGEGFTDKEIYEWINTYGE